MDLDKFILEAVKGHTPENPKDLVGILYHVDGRMKLVMSDDELEGGLRRLVETGRIAELSAHRFYEVTGALSPGIFSGLSGEEHCRACEVYRKWFWKTLKELKKK
jgi:hypothetical protein